MFDPNPLMQKMAVQFKETVELKGEKLIICNEGGTRSSKTWSVFDLIIWICARYKNANLDFYILRDTLIHCKDFTLKDFIKLLQIDKYYDSAKLKEYPKPYYNLFGNNIYFRGLDDERAVEGYPSDYIFVNEVLETEKSKVDGLLMRCRKMVVFDWNPKLTRHWVFDLEGQPNVIFFRSTFLDNKHLEKSVIDGIKALEPTPFNIENKTANLFRWKVYGLGVRTDQEGNVFNDSQLNKYEWSEIDLKSATIIAYGDIADQGIDYFSFVVGAIIGKCVYLIDVIFTPKTIETWMPQVIELIEKYDISKVKMESNNQGLMATKYIKSKIAEKYKNRIIAAPNCQNKHTRICIQAETNIIPNFYFLKNHNGQYSTFMDFLYSYKHDKSFKQDDAPDSLAGLSIFASKII